MLTIFGAVGSGSIPIEAMLTLLGVPYEVIEAVTWEDEAARRRVETVNPLGQVPALVQVDADPRLKEFWAKRFPFDEAWER